MARGKKPSDTSDETGTIPEDDQIKETEVTSDLSDDTDPSSDETAQDVDATEDLAATPAPNLEDTDAGMDVAEDDATETGEGPSAAPGVPPGVDEETRADTVTPVTAASEPELTEPDRSETLAETPPAATTPPPTQSTSSSGIGFGGFVALLLGGVIAGGIGWFLAQNTAPPQVTTDPVDTSGLEQSITDQSDRIASLEGQSGRLQAIEDRLEAIPEQGAPLDTSGLEATQSDLITRMDAVSKQVATIEQALQNLVDEVQTLADRPAQVSPDGAQAMAEQLATFRSELETLTADAQSQVEEARARASEVELQAQARELQAAQETALAEVRAALQDGSPYADALTTFEDVPESLSAPADDGVPTLAELRESFPDAARVALNQSQALPENTGVGDRLSAFLRRQTNARSLEPREGDDTDAVLSRSEAALGSADLDTTLAELDGLSDQAAEALSEWRSRVELRRDALAGYDALSARLTDN